MKDTEPFLIPDKLVFEMNAAGIYVVHSKDEIRRICNEHGNRNPNMQNLDYASLILEMMLFMWNKRGTWSEILGGKKVLDIGAGSMSSHGQSYSYTPDFSRLCAMNGAYVVALDIGAQSFIDSQLFKTVQIDLIDPVMNIQFELIPELNGQKFDIIHSSNFIGNMDPGLLASLSDRKIRAHTFSQRLEEQALKLLAEDGILYLGEYQDYITRKIYTKKDGVIIPIRYDLG